MATLILGFCMFVFAVASFWDGMRITRTLRVPGAFDLIGPDRYIMGVAVLVGLLGAGLIFQSVSQLRREGRIAVVDENAGSYVHVWLVGILLAYALFHLRRQDCARRITKLG